MESSSKLELSFELELLLNLTLSDLWSVGDANGDDDNDDDNNEDDDDDDNDDDDDDDEAIIFRMLHI